MQQEIFPVPGDWAKKAWIDDAKYQEIRLGEVRGLVHRETRYLVVPTGGQR